jgi:hypothetical protein
MRKVIVLAEAAEDIEQAGDFYEAQQSGIGDYCVDSLLAGIESWRSITEFMPNILDFIGCSLTGFHSAFITAK